MPASFHMSSKLCIALTIQLPLSGSISTGSKSPTCCPINQNAPSPSSTTPQSAHKLSSTLPIPQNAEPVQPVLYPSYPLTPSTPRPSQNIRMRRMGVRCRAVQEWLRSLGTRAWALALRRRDPFRVGHLARVFGGHVQSSSRHRRESLW